MSTPSIAEQRYVSITTYKRSGDAVSSPVWIAPLADGTAGFTTGSTSGKVKRIRNNAHVVLRPCDARGRVADGATEVPATASIVDGEAGSPVKDAIKRKYGFQMTMVELSGKVRSLFSKSTAADCAIVLHFDA